MKTKLARRVTEIDVLIIDDVPRRVQAVEAIGYGSDPDKTTIFVQGLPAQHFWYDQKVTVK